MDYKPLLSMVIDGNTYSYKLFDALKIISNTYSQRKAAEKLGVSHAVLNRRIKYAEEKLGFKLTYSTGAGSVLTDEAFKIIGKYEKYTKRLQKRDKLVICGGYSSTRLMEILCSEYGLDAAVYKTGDKEALYLASMDMVDILTFDDPVHALIRNLDFTPIAYDYLVLLSPSKSSPHSIDELKDKNFIEIEDSPQRLAWNTLDDAGIPYTLKSRFKSPYDVLNFIEAHDDFYTFINHSLKEGSEIIKDNTRHVISFVPCNGEDTRIDDFLKFILTYRGQKIVEKSGFEMVR
ncbi:MAG: LysR family transcriptional regulator [Methanobacterium sp.]